LKTKMVNWFKEHKRMRVILPSVVMMLALVAAMLPVYADALTYLDVTGTYDVSSRAVPRYMDNTRHPTTQFGELTITTQTGKAITVATLECLGADIALTGLVGPGTVPTIVLAGTDSDGTVTSIQGKVKADATGLAAASISGRIMTYVTSDGERKTNAGTGTAVISAAAYHSEPLSALITQGAGAGSVGIQLNHPVNRLTLRNLATLKAGQLGFWFNLESAKTPGPYIGLRFAPAGTADTDLFPAVDVGHVDITVMPYQSLTGAGAWVECDLTSASGRAIYYGNDPTDETAFSWEEEAGNYTLADMEALINAETAMTAGGDNASDWVLTTVYIVLYEAGVKTCYVDDITAGGQVYTLEPNSYFSNFKATIQD